MKEYVYVVNYCRNEFQEPEVTRILGIYKNQKDALTYVERVYNL